MRGGDFRRSKSLKYNDILHGVFDLQMGGIAALSISWPRSPSDEGEKVIVIKRFNK